MKRFSFRYQTLLDVRERAQKQEEDRLSTLMGRQHAEEATLAAVTQEEIDLRAAWTERVQGQLDLDALLMMQTSLDAMAHKIAQQKHAVELARARADNQREILIKVQQDAEVMRKLKKRDLDAWHAAVEKAEAQFLDELATLRYARKAI